MSRCGLLDVAVEEHLEEVDAGVLVSFGGVVSLSSEHGVERFVGRVVDAVFADGFELAVEDCLPAATRQHIDDYSKCTECGRVYWRGAHHPELSRIIETVRRGKQVNDECQRNPLERRRSVQQLAVYVRLNDQVVLPLGMGSQLVRKRPTAVEYFTP